MSRYSNLLGIPVIWLTHQTATANWSTDLIFSPFGHQIVYNFNWPNWLSQQYSHYQTSPKSQFICLSLRKTNGSIWIRCNAFSCVLWGNPALRLVRLSEVCHFYMFVQNVTNLSGTKNSQKKLEKCWYQ